MNEVDRSVSSGTVQEKRPYEKFVDYLQRTAAANSDSNGFEVAAGMMDKILTAETEKEIWDADEGGIVGMRDLEDAELEISDFKILKSSSQEYESDLGVYIVGDATMLADYPKRALEAGQEIVFNTGSPGIIAKLQAFKSKGLMPVQARVKGIQASNGTVLKLRPIPKRAVQADSK